MTKFLFISISLSVFVITSLKAQKGYIATDTSSSDVQIIDQGVFRNNREVRFSKSKKGLPTTYYPQDLKEFGFEGSTYITKFVTEGDSKTPYFLLRLSNGPIKLYLLKTRKGNRFFGEGNEEILELAEDSYKEALLKIATDHSLDNSLILVKHNKKSLERFFFLHNRSYKGLFPTLRKGFIFGLSNSLVSINEFEGGSISLGNDVSPIFGVFIDFPLGLNPKWFLNAQAY
ncbi:MAG: hypothetical protein O9262_00645, partial [Cyclobacteriaceae bacterium]|nr:hypothetical protein [Cyclobacteriaceae bacterium]